MRYVLISQLKPVKPAPSGAVLTHQSLPHPPLTKQQVVPFVSDYRKHRCACFGKVQTITSEILVKSPGVWAGRLRTSLPSSPQPGVTGASTKSSGSIALQPCVPAVPQQEVLHPSQTPSPATQMQFYYSHRLNAPTRVGKKKKLKNQSGCTWY